MKSCFIIDDIGRLDNGSLDRVYLRTCAVYKLLKASRIGQDRAVALLAEKGVGSRIVEIWLEHFEKINVR